MHGALELTVAIAVAVLPFALGLPPAAIAVGVGVGVLMGGLALGAAVTGSAPTLPVAAHAAYDRALAVVLVAIGLGGALAGNLAALVFTAAGLVYAALIASTRYTRPA